jgi:hypothetical protein
MGRRKQLRQVAKIRKALQEDTNIAMTLEAWQIEALAFILWQSGVRYKKNPPKGL